jgi:DNA replicative helicase MCM subunit Mcm2 (Cdc46/Mcm family)
MEQASEATSGGSNTSTSDEVGLCKLVYIHCERVGHFFIILRSEYLSGSNYSQDMEFKDFARRPDAYQEICRLIAPSIFGHDDVKKAVACLLFSGSRKVCSSPTCWHCNLKFW